VKKLLVILSSLMVPVLLLTACGQQATPTPIVVQAPSESPAPTLTLTPERPAGNSVSIPEPTGGGYQVAYWEDGLYLTNTDGGEPILLEKATITGVDNGVGKPWVWSPDGSKVAYSLLNEKKTIILDLERGLRFEYALYEPPAGNGYYATLEWHPEGQMLAAMIPGGQLYFLDPETGQSSAPFYAPSYRTELNNSFRLSPDGQTIAFLVWSDSLNDNAIHLYSLLTDDLGHPQSVGELNRIIDFDVTFPEFEWLPGGEKIIVGNVWLNDEMEHMLVLDMDGSGQVELFAKPGIAISEQINPWAISPDGSRIAFRAMDLNNQADNKIYVTEPDGNGLREITDSAYPSGSNPDWSPDGQKLLFSIGGAGIGATILCNQDGTQKTILPISPGATIVRFRPVAAVPSTSTMPTLAASDSPRITPENAAALTVVNTLAGHSASVEALAFSPDGTRLASSAYNDPVRVWDVATGQILQLLAGNADGASSLAFSPDGARLASGGFDSLVKIWDAEDGGLVSTLQGHTDMVLAVAFSPDGELLVSTGFDDTVRLWDVRNEQLVASMEIPNIGYDIEFSYDGKYLAVAGGSLLIWDTSHFESGYSTLGSSMSVAFSPVADLAAAEGFNAIVLWEPSTGEQVNILPGVTESGTSLEIVFSPDGKLVASVSDSGLVQLWNVVGGTLLTTYSGELPQYSQTAIAFSPDGTLVAFSCGEGDICLWGIP
jgi:WD40 repeat protein